MDWRSAGMSACGVMFMRGVAWHAVGAPLHAPSGAVVGSQFTLFVLSGAQRSRSTISVALNRRMSRCDRRAGLARQASYLFLSRQE